MKHILITGASSGLGRALALDYAGPEVLLSLCARNEARLQEVAGAARAKGAEVHMDLVDVRQRGQLEDWFARAAARAPLDLVFANAGISAGTGSGGETLDQALEIIDINVIGAVQTVMLAGAHMLPRGQGQIAIFSSLAGFRGVAGAPAYGASRAATRVYGEALRCEWADKGVKVNVICPGFVATPMTDANGFYMPFLMPAERAARIIRNGLERNQGRISFPWPMAALVWLVSALPVVLTDWIIGRLPKKP
jgi:short-subunit dehydrogenase